jgi:transcriptional pleiotropic regulator of transition state genes
MVHLELRRTLDIAEKDPLEIFTDESGAIILKKYQPTCAVCNDSSDLVESLAKHGIKICRKCLKAAEQKRKPS